MGVTENLFGYLPNGHPVMKYTLEQGSGMRCSVLDFGGIIQELLVPDVMGQRRMRLQS